jgi:peptidoglycan hydrolase-like protein with peptidoglycan-binding domain
MSYALTWLPEVLERAGLKVATCPGWENRGRGEMGLVRGVMCHHTAGGRHGNMPSLDLLIKGRADLAGPLAQLGLGRDGTFYVIAAGRCNHAGAGSWKGVTTGNTSFIGIEAENTGRDNDFPWPDVQVRAYQCGVAAILAHLKLDVGCCAGHREYALPAGRKPDPNFSMQDFRAGVASFMLGSASMAPIPASVQVADKTWDTLRRGAQGEHVTWLRRHFSLADPPSVFDAPLEARVRAFQLAQGLVPDGIVGPKTWRALGQL